MKTNVRVRKKRFIAMLMAFVMVLSLVPGIRAEASTDYNANSYDNRSLLNEKLVFPGDTFDFGDQEKTVEYKSFASTSKKIAVHKGTHTVLDYSDSQLGFDTNDDFRCWRVTEVNVSGGADIVLTPVSKSTYYITYVLPEGGDYKNADDNPDHYTSGTGKIQIKNATRVESDKDFIGWFRNADYTGDIVKEISKDENADITLYALFKGANSKITYYDATDNKEIGKDGNTASFVDSNNNPAIYTEGEANLDINGGKFGDAQKKHYAFDGWYIDEKCEQKITGLTRANVGDILIRAKFIPNSYNINYNANGGELKSGVTNPATYTFGNSETLNELTKTGYVFSGWYSNSDYTGNPVTEITINNIDSLLNTTDNTINLYAKFTPMTATLTLDDDNPTTAGSAESYTLTYDSDMPQITLPVKENYIFDGYYLDGVQFVKADGDWNEINGLIESKKWKSENSSLNLTAKWKADSFVIAYDLNGGTNDANNPASYTYGEGVASFKDATKTGYNFTGWYSIHGSEETKVESISATQSGNVSLKAHYTPKTATLVLEDNGGTGGAADPSGLTYDSVMPTITIPTRDSYTFDGYYVGTVQYVGKDGSWNNVDGKIVNGKWASEDTSLTITAKWTPVDYKITYELNGGTLATANPEGYTYGTGIASEAINAPTKKGYTFDGWYDATEGGNKVTSISTTDSGDKKLYAQWTINQYKVTFVDENGTTVLKEAASYDYGTKAADIVKPDAPTKAKTTEYTYTFTGWTPEIADVSDSDVTYKATYSSTKNQYTVIWKDGNGETLKTETLEYGKTPSYDGIAPTKTATPAYTYTFNNTWTPAITTVTGDVTYTAEFVSSEIQYSLKFDGNGATVIDSTSVDGATVMNDQSFAYDVEKALNANEYVKTGYSFKEWNTKRDGTGTSYADKAAFKLQSDVTLYAQWTVNQYNVTFVDEDGTTVLKEATAYDYGTKAADIVKPDEPSKSATAEYTYAFAGWTPEISDVNDADATYKAVYTATKNKYTITWVDGDGNTIKTDSIEYGETPVFNGDSPAKTATVSNTYKFNNNWMPAIAKVTGDATYTAQFDESVKQYEVTFDGNGATGLDGKEGLDMAGQLCDYNIETALNANEYVKKGYAFTGWNSQADGTGDNYADKDTIKLTSDCTLYAQWKLVDYSITYVTKMGKYFDGTYPDSNPKTYTYGTTIGVGSGAETALKVAEVVPNSENYTFDAWYTDEAFTGSKFEGIGSEDIGDITLYAKYIPKTFEIKYIIDDDAKKINGNPDTYDYGTGIVELADVVKDGYIFEGWFSDPEFTKKITCIDPTQSGNIKIYAKLVLKPIEKLEIPTSKTEGDIKGSKFIDLLAGVVKCTKNSIQLKWKKVEGADGYLIYGNQCNHHGHKYKYKYITKLGPNKTSWTAKKLRKNKYYKYYVAAYRMVDGKREIITISKTVHATTLSKKYGIAQKVKVNKSTVNLAAGGTFKLKAKEVNVSRKIQVHRAICFESTDTDIATVNKKGRIKAISPGECKIYIFAQNGKFTTCKVIVE